MLSGLALGLCHCWGVVIDVYREHNRQYTCPPLRSRPSMSSPSMSSPSMSSPAISAFPFGPVMATIGPSFSPETLRALFYCERQSINGNVFELVMLARLRTGQRDGRRRQADDDFGGWVKTSRLRQWTKFREILGRCRGPFVILTPFPDCLYQVPRRRYSHGRVRLT